MITIVNPPHLQGDDWFEIEPNDRYNFVGDSEKNPKGYTNAAIFVGSGGSIVLVSENGTTLSFDNIANGTWIPQSVIRVNATGTTCTGIRGIIGKYKQSVL